MIMACSFCTDTDVGERTVAENGTAFAFLTNIPLATGHVLICPKRCARGIGDLSREELEDIFELRARLKPALEKAFGAKGFNYAWNENQCAGQTVPHFHLHMVPRGDGDTKRLGYDPRDMLYGRRDGRKAVPLGESIKVKEALKKLLPSP
jgi:histidine triad (HIT) family protein